MVAPLCLRFILLLCDADLPQGWTQSGHFVLDSADSVYSFVPSGGDVWLVHDSNYGHRTIVHERSISGYVIVNPNQQVVTYHHKKYAGSF